ncbi:MAG: protein kinase [Planctomycetia bacterium]|nr:protein kinase [Planctomycetia bacterium]
MPETAEQVVDTLRSRGYCTEEQVQEGLEIQRKMRDMGVNPKPLVEILLDKGYLTKDQYRDVTQKAVNEKGALEKDSIPGYELLKKIGQGGMGAVFQARQLSMDRIVALKVLPPKLAKDAQFRERFLREARAVAKLNHENIIQGIDVGTANGLNYFVMEFVDGQPVSKRMTPDKPLPEKEVLSICGQIARALEHAWRHKLVHRDVKPENIMVTGEGVAKLCDLGLAKQETGDVGLTQAGLSVGTPNYISPEQARGEADVDIRSDVYSLGASLYHMLTGKVPFEGTVPSVVMTKHITEELVPPQKHKADLSAEANAIVLRAMQKRREDRYPDPSQMAADLEAAATGKPLVFAKVAAPPAPARKAVPAAGIPAASDLVRRPLHTPAHPPAHAGPKTAALVAPIAIATVVALAIVGGVVMMNRGKKAPENPGTTASGGNTPAGGGKTENPTGTGTTPAVDVEAERQKKLEQEFKALVGFIDLHKADPGKYSEIESRLEEFMAANRKTAWENLAIAERKKLRDGLDASALALLEKIRSEIEPIRKAGKAWEAYQAAQGRWMKHLSATPTAQKYEALLTEIDAEMQAAWNRDREAAKAFRDGREFEKALAALNDVRTYASPQIVSQADTLKAEIRKAAEEYAAKLVESGKQRYEKEFWPALEKLLFERKHKEALAHCGKYFSDPEMVAVRDRISAMIDDVTSLNLVMGDAARGADAAAKSKEPVNIKNFEVRITGRDGDRVTYAFLNGGSSEINIPKAAEEDLAILCQLAYNALPADRKAAEKGPYFFRIGLLFFFTEDEKDRKRAGEELEKAAREGVDRARWYLDRLAEKGLTEGELAAKRLYDDAFGSLEARKYGEARQRFQRLLGEMAGTAWVKDHRATIEAKIRECDQKLGGGDASAIQTVLKGTVIKVHPRGQIEVRYDFSKEEQLQDWTTGGGTWSWDKATESLRGVAPEDATRGLNWTVPLVGDLTIDLKMTPAGERGAGISVHNDAAGHSYFAIFGGFAAATAQALGNPDLKSLALAKVNIGGRQPFSVFQSAADPKMVRGQESTVRVTRAGKSLSLYWGGKRVLTGEDDAFTRGQVSLFLQGCEARFDDITIYGTPDEEWVKARLSGGK